MNILGRAATKFLILMGLLAILEGFNNDLRAQELEIPRFPLSSLGNEGCPACNDTLNFVVVKKIFDIGLLLPEWKPVVDPHLVSTLEGRVSSHSAGYTSCHVSPIDYSAYHYTHDLGFNVLPDEDYKYLLSRRIYTGIEENEHGYGEEGPDTVLQNTIHVEWETGVGADNKGNLCAEANRKGESCGFFSTGHQRRDQFWNWPTIGDWVHLEGQWIWDRGHPPARTEIHPIRFCAIQRHLPDRIDTGEDSVFATRFDIYASGDGGALNNNRKNVPDFVKPVRMSDKDYSFIARPILPRPSPNAKLKASVLKHPGDSHPAELRLEESSDENGPHFIVRQAWLGHDDEAVVARTIFLYWDEGEGIPEDFKIYSCTVDFEHIRFRRRKEFSSRSEWRIFLEAGGKWIFLNEFLDCKDPLRGKKAQTYSKNWKANQKVTFYVPENVDFRVHMGGWEADGINRAFGHLLDPEAPCTRATKKLMHRHLLPAIPLTMHGCLDDMIGEVHAFFKPEDIKGRQGFEMSGRGKRDRSDPCLLANGIRDDIFELRFWVEMKD